MFVDDGTLLNIHHLITSDTEDGYIGTKRALNLYTVKMPRPECFDYVDIEERLTQTYNRERAKTDEIGDLRQAISYPCEDNVKALEYIFNQAKNGHVWEGKADFFVDLMKNVHKGKANPKSVEQLVDEIFNLAIN